MTSVEAAVTSVIVCVAIAGLFVLGFGLGRDSTFDDCRETNVVRIKQVVYDCTVTPRAKQGGAP
jgi:hypothetical protein